MKNSRGTIFLNKISLAALLSILCFLSNNGMASAQENELNTKGDIYYDYICKRAQMLNDFGDFQSWPIEKKAELDQLLVEGDYFSQQSDPVMNILPEDDDLPRESARALAASTIAELFNVERQSVDTWHVDYSFWGLSSGHVWMLLFTEDKIGEDKTYDVYRVEIESPSGKIAACWKEEHSKNRNMAVDKEEPGIQNIGEEEALDIAQKYVRDNLAEEYRLNREILSTFSVSVGFISDYNSHSVWMITFVPSDQVLYEYFGSFSIALSSSTGEILEVDTSSNG